jgi:predicted transcriptional regulator of viral defense system
MEFRRLIEIAADLHCFSPGMVTAGERLDQVRVQLSRWVQSGRVVRIHKGWYTLAGPYRRVIVDPFVVACAIKPGTYVSLQSALSYHGMIPEYVPETTCVTTGRPLVIETPFGRLRYRHIKGEAFWGYDEDQRGSQSTFVAKPEKALLDLIYLTPDAANRNYITELRLEGLDDLYIGLVADMARRFGNPKLGDLPKVLSELKKEARGGMR